MSTLRTPSPNTGSPTSNRRLRILSSNDPNLSQKTYRPPTLMVRSWGGIIRPGCTTFRIHMPTRGPDTSTFQRSSTKTTLGVKSCFRSVLRADLSLPLNEGLEICSLRNTLFSRYIDLHRSYGSLLFVVVVIGLLQSVSIRPVSRATTMYMIISMRHPVGLLHRHLNQSISISISSSLHTNGGLPGS